MTRMPRPATLSVNPLFVQLASVIFGGAIVVSIALYTSSVVGSSLHRAGEESTAALLTSQIQAEVDAVAVLNLTDGLGIAAGTTRDADARIPLDKAIAAHDALMVAGQRSDALHALIGSDVTLQIWGAMGEANSALDLYLAEPTALTFSELELQLTALGVLTRFEAPRLAASAQAHQDRATTTTQFARTATMVAILFAAVEVGITTLVIGRRLRRALASAEDEKKRLVEASQIMQRRNEQFGALYQVVSEVTESLSMRYVVNTTIREARKLVGADVVDLRRLERSELALAGMEHDAGQDIAGLGTVALGTGIIGRAAKRGKTFRIDEGAEALMADGERIPAMESGLVVPLIVGARVVGTLGCWSREPGHFTVDDERILEMMASQVATAIASADTHETSEHDANHDALTQLPNRRQLNEDTKGELGKAIISGEPMAIAMIDIDHFKRFNDDFGHKVGDVTLQKVAQVLRGAVRDGDRVYRFGGEEFIVVFKGADADEGLRLAERLRINVAETPLTGDTLRPVGPVTISIGVAACPEHGTNVETLVDMADRAMYASKEMGRNRVTLVGNEPEHLQKAA